jgi:hypothetical protein
MRKCILLLFCVSLTACGADTVSAEKPATREDKTMVQKTTSTAVDKDESTASALAQKTTSTCSDLDQSPCLLVGQWKIVAVYDASLPASERLSDPNAMIGATFSLKDEPDNGGSLKFDGPDTGQYNVSAQCDMPYLDKKGDKSPQLSVGLLQKAISAFNLPAVKAADIRKLACESGHWATAIDPQGHEAVFTKPTGDELVITWLGDVVLHATRIG